MKCILAASTNPVLSNLAIQSAIFHRDDICMWQAGDAHTHACPDRQAGNQEGKMA
jgi:hypothetical protein